MRSITIAVPPQFRDAVAPTALRFNYLFPECALEPNGDQVIIHARSEEGLSAAAQQWRYTLYREALLTRFETERVALYGALFK